MSVGCIGHLQHTIFKTMNEPVLEYMLDMDIDLACGNIILTAIIDKRYASVDRLLWDGANCNDVSSLDVRGIKCLSSGAAGSPVSLLAY